MSARALQIYYSSQHARLIASFVQVNAMTNNVRHTAAILNQIKTLISLIA